MTKNITEIHNNIIKAIYTAEVAAKASAGEHFTAVLRADGTVYDGFGLVWDKKNDTELFCAYRDPNGIEENNIGLDKFYSLLFAKNSWYENGVLCMTDGQNAFKFRVTDTDKIVLIEDED